jgi:DNA-directed RNA polymerase subunit M/transcription elongation factor TFIIS
MLSVASVVCPECSTPSGYFLQDMSGISHANWYRCPTCGNVWSVEKTSQQPAAPAPDVAERSAELVNRRPLKAALRTTYPPMPAPMLRCPKCDRTLWYRESVVSGAFPVEQWDQFMCRQCGIELEYRQRTRRLKILSRR